MKQYSVLFKRYYNGDDSVATQLNDYLRDHPNYIISKILFNDDPKTTHESLFVVFDIEEEIKN